MKHYIKIVIGVSNYTVSPVGTKSFRIMKDIIYKFSSFKYKYDYKTKRQVMEVDNIYLGNSRINNTLYLPISTLNYVVGVIRMNGGDIQTFIKSKDKIDTAVPVDIKLNDDYILREYQETHVLKIVEHSSKIILIPLQTGKGKGIISMATMSRLPYRNLIMVLPMYITKWVDELIEKTNITKEDIYIIRGKDSINKAVEMVSEGNFNYKIVIMSIRTSLLFIKNFENKLERDFLESYDVTPLKFTEVLGIGYIYSDESHQEFHALYKSIVYYDVKKVICMSATYLSRDPYIKTMHSHLIPPKARLEGILEYHKYIHLYPVRYTTNPAIKLHYTSQEMYSHHLYEVSVMKNNKLLHDYRDMIVKYLEDTFINRRRDNEIALIYCKSVALCTYLTGYIGNRYKKLTTKRYTADDPYNNLMTADIIVTTDISSSTAIDVKGLISVYQTINLSSIVANIQSLGRLRFIEDRDVEFYYFYNASIDKHISYHKERLEILGERSKTTTMQSYNTVLGIFPNRFKL